MSGWTFETLWKELVRAQRRVIQLQGALAAFVADNRNARLSLKAQQALAVFNPNTVKGRMLDLLNESPTKEFKSAELAKELNATVNAVRLSAFELIRDGYIIRVRHGVYKAIAEDDVEGVEF